MKKVINELNRIFEEEVGRRPTDKEILKQSDFIISLHKKFPETHPKNKKELLLMLPKLIERDKGKPTEEGWIRMKQLLMKELGLGKSLTENNRTWCACGKLIIRLMGSKDYIAPANIDLEVCYDCFGQGDLY